MLKIFVKGYVGNLGTRILIEKKYDDLSKRFSKEYLNDLTNVLDKYLKDGEMPSLNLSNKDFFDTNYIDKEKIGKGGILASLWKICERNKWGLKYSLRKIPILQGTIEIANYFDINPYRLLTDNAFIIACEFVGADIIRPQYRGEVYEPFSEIGDITNEKKRVRIDGESEAFLTKDFKDEINKVIPNYTKTVGLV